MKKLLTICLLLATAFTVKAQDMSFEQTVKYINDKISCCTNSYPGGFGLQNIVVTKEGFMTVNYTNGNNTKIDLLGLYKHQDGKSIYSENNKLKFCTSVNTQDVWLIISQPEGEKIVKAFTHLQSLYTKQKDPFDN